MQHRNFGFDTANRYILHIDPQMAGYKSDKLEPLYRQLHDNISAIPGVQQVSFSLYSPMEGDNWGRVCLYRRRAAATAGNPRPWRLMAARESELL